MLRLIYSAIYNPENTILADLNIDSLEFQLVKMIKNYKFSDHITCLRIGYFLMNNNTQN